jgi:predicted nucleic acid-binding protein
LQATHSVAVALDQISAEGRQEFIELSPRTRRIRRPLLECDLRLLGPHCVAAFLHLRLANRLHPNLRLSDEFHIAVAANYDIADGHRYVSEDQRPRAIVFAHLLLLCKASFC